MGTSGRQDKVHGVGGTNSKFTYEITALILLLGSIPRVPKSH